LHSTEATRHADDACTTPRIASPTLGTSRTKAEFSLTKNLIAADDVLLALETDYAGVVATVNCGQTRISLTCLSRCTNTQVDARVRSDRGLRESRTDGSQSGQSL
jgi:hypothetical protein